MDYRKMDIKRKVTLFLCICVFALYLFSTFLTIYEADHDCTSEVCLICIIIHTAEKVLKQVSLIKAALWDLLFLNVNKALILEAILLILIASTPVELKVKMNN
ncbi:hypothetical protein [Tissierella sp. Yu-01]|uniref:hypothetical protein n=1 Tax=Tissierella sp. Yu-01 TaxID=3035694 RepID=UPI00240CED22|nr:hypothetical protein [Tissierella sp. Yu-01]WFA08932.1 hypothetical protein P3962_14595 [Tissierella sp. Yu-01]